MKRKAEEEYNEERKRPGLTKENDEDMSEVRQGLQLMGFNVDLIDWLLDGNLDIINELNEVRRAVRLYGKGQQEVQAHVTEAYSPVRVTGMADKMGLIPGLAMDLTTRDEHGNPWDFNCDAMRAKAKKIVKSNSSLLLVVSPMCSAFSRLQAFNAKRLGPDKMKEMIDYGLKHLTFALDLCEIQRSNGLYFLLGHPAGASR